MPLTKNEVEALVSAARSVRDNAYAPYSQFRVGAALLCDDGSIVTGCNVENSSYSLTCCAERTAVFTAVAQGKRSFTAMAIATSRQPVAPCGACRQVLAEFNPAMTLILCDENADHAFRTMTDLLPDPFTPDMLAQ
ncbi:MAG: cytidine deaminase [Bacteroidia bacterium]|nr:cytidine deaminase [Bacteroidia bacterium]